VIHFLFPADGADPRQPDEMFADQWAAHAGAGFSASLCPDAVLTGAKSLRNVPVGSRVVYRGWMLREREYDTLVRAIEGCEATAFTGPSEYLLAHHLPNWYPLIPELTPETRVYLTDADLVAELRALGWGAYFIKDYVKSLKTGCGPIARDPAEVAEIIAAMKEYRGEIEGGVCVRRVEEFVPDSEKRYFVLRGVGHAASEGEQIPDVVRQCAERIRSPFFSVDVVERADGELRVVEVGDGQVSDLVGWSAPAFAAMWLRGGEEVVTGTALG
jgi:hypothetical protein